jgi:hypothetical protein
MFQRDVTLLDRYKNPIVSCTTHFLLLYYFVATCFGPAGPSSGHIDAVCEVKLCIKLQIKVHKAALHKMRLVLWPVLYAV